MATTKDVGYRSLADMSHEEKLDHIFRSRAKANRYVDAVELVRWFPTEMKSEANVHRFRAYTHLLHLVHRDRHKEAWEWWGWGWGYKRSESIELLDDAGWLPFYEGLINIKYDKDLYSDTLALLDCMPLEDNYIGYNDNVKLRSSIAILFMFSGSGPTGKRKNSLKSVRSFLDFNGFIGRDKEAILSLVRNLNFRYTRIEDERKAKRAMNQLAPASFDDLILTYGVMSKLNVQFEQTYESVVRLEEQVRRKNLILPVTGNDIKNHFGINGPEIGLILGKLYQRRTEFYNKESAMIVADRIMEEINDGCID